MRGSFLSTGGMRSDPCACSSGGEPFDRYPPRTSHPTSPLIVSEHLFYGMAICLTGLRFKRENENLKRKFCTDLYVRSDGPIYIASTVTYSKHDEYKDDDGE